VVVVAFQVLADADTFASALGGVFGLIIYCVLGFFALAVALFLLGKILVLLGWAMGRLHATTKSKAVKPARVQYDVSQRANFTYAATVLQGAIAERSHANALAALSDLDALLARCSSSGQLPPDLERELELFARRHVGLFINLSDDVGLALVTLIRHYDPHPSLWFRWKTRALR